jgi:hypothetical protein
MIVIDTGALQKLGYQPLKDALIWGILLYPVYLYKRARRLLQKQTLFFFSLFIAIVPTIGAELIWPLLDRKDIETVGARITNQLLPFANAAECTSAELVKRMPYCKYEVAAHLSDGRTVIVPLVQSWKNMNLDLEKISGDLSLILLEKALEIEKAPKI